MSSAAREYAKALFLSIDDSTEKTEVLNSLRVVTAAVELDLETFSILKGHGITDDEKKNALSKVTEKLASKDILNQFFSLLVDKRRVALIPEISQFFEELNDIENNVLRGVVKSAVVLSPSERKDLEKKLENKLGKKTILSYVQDEKVVGGVRAQVGAYTFDDTIQTHIKNIKGNLDRSWN